MEELSIVGSLPIREIVGLEWEIVERLGWKVVVTEGEVQEIRGVLCEGTI